MDDKPSPGLDLRHGFVHKIKKQLVKRDQSDKDFETEKMEIAKKQLAGMRKPTVRRPTQVTYCPPARRERSISASSSPVSTTPPDSSSSGDSDVLTAAGREPATCLTNGTTSVKKPPTEEMTTQRFPPASDKQVNMAGSVPQQMSTSANLRSSDQGSRLPAAESVDISNYDIGGFGEEAQWYIRKALQDPTSLGKQDLCQVFNVLMWRAMEEPEYARTGAQLCHAIIQVEVEKEQYDCVPTRVFQSHLRLKLLEQEMEAETLHEQSVSAWVGFVRFLCLCYHVIRVRDSPLMTMVDSVFNCLSLLALPGPLKNEMQVDCLYNLLVQMGPSLDQTVPDKMEDLFALLRDRFLSFKTPPLARHRLLQLIELRSGGWQMEPGIQDYYSRSGKELRG
ncbi:MIF4GD [Branchiostoma lanceolatum]|uniref:MIF4GD protein n=1 Tax=Branchiostoma lanceolatum TaxID=7740 RepID=A0A8K0AF34_BRALA|nr:MIF4GD [Branchiostoma lanceolatum]